MSIVDDLKNRIDNLPAIRNVQVLSETISEGEHYHLSSSFGRSYLLKIIKKSSFSQIEKDTAENRLWLAEGLPVQRIIRAGMTKDGEAS